MGRKIKLTATEVAAFLKEFEDKLLGFKLTDGKLTVSKSFDTTDKAVLTFTQEAWMKMQYLVHTFSSEVGWYGTAYRAEGGYEIRDILMYPQTVSGVTVTTDQEEYDKWMKELPDEVFNNMRMHGHSHVNMSTTPSAVDIQNQESNLAMLPADSFYVFLIWNKKGEKTIKIYDYKTNVLYENKDITIVVSGADTFFDDVKNMVKTQVYTYGGSYGYGYGYGSSKSQTTTSSTSTITKTDTGTKKGKRKKKEKGGYKDPVYGAR